MPNSASRFVLRVWIIVLLLHFANCFSIQNSRDRSAPLLGKLPWSWQYKLIGIPNFPVLDIRGLFLNPSAMFATSAAL